MQMDAWIDGWMLGIHVWMDRGVVYMSRYMNIGGWIDSCESISIDGLIS